MAPFDRAPSEPFTKRDTNSFTPEAASRFHPLYSNSRPISVRANVPAI